MEVKWLWVKSVILHWVRPAPNIISFNLKGLTTMEAKWVTVRHQVETWKCSCKSKLASWATKITILFRLWASLPPSRTLSWCNRLVHRVSNKWWWHLPTARTIIITLPKTIYKWASQPSSCTTSEKSRESNHLWEVSRPKTFRMRLLSTGTINLLTVRLLPLARIKLSMLKGLM